MYLEAKWIAGPKIIIQNMYCDDQCTRRQLMLTASSQKGFKQHLNMKEKHLLWPRLSSAVIRN